ncbi:MAG TPA: hypothetical protein VFT04_06965 [Gemmatimonadales bacterium]|nr:hypothetical protein [Gemmatimonadales bacterium]
MSETSARSELLRLVVGVVVIDLLAIGTYVFGGLGTASPRTRIVFAGIWTFATLVVVLIGLRRLREARISAMRGPTRR